MPEHVVLFKRTSTGAIQEWRIEVRGSSYRTVSGQQDGQHVESGWKTAQPKNVGRANETSAKEQCRLEVEAKYAKKLAQGGYHSSIENIDKPKFFKPMLAQNFDKVGVDFETQTVFSQPKLDGVRCIADQFGLWTRQGKPIVAVPHVSAALAPLFEQFPTLVLDGELYADKLAQDFNKIISLVRKQKPTEERLAEAARTITYNVYDMPSLHGEFSARQGGVVDLLASTSTCIVEVETRLVTNSEELDELYGQYVAAGYEGQMVRISEVYYEQKRSKQLLKRKQFMDVEFTVVSVNEGVGNRGGMAGFIEYVLPDGRMFRSGIKGTHAYCKDLLDHADEYPGGMGTVRFFDYTPDGFPRFPVTVSLFKEKRST